MFALEVLVKDKACAFRTLARHVQVCLNKLQVKKCARVSILVASALKYLNWQQYFFPAVLIDHLHKIFTVTAKLKFPMAGKYQKLIIKSRNGKVEKSVYLARRSGRNKRQLLYDISAPHSFCWTTLYSMSVSS